MNQSRSLAASGILLISARSLLRIAWRSASTSGSAPGSLAAVGSLATRLMARCPSGWKPVTYLLRHSIAAAPNAMPRRKFPHPPAAMRCARRTYGPGIATKCGKLLPAVATRPRLAPRCTIMPPGSAGCHGRKLLAPGHIGAPARTGDGRSGRCKGQHVAQRGIVHPVQPVGGQMSLLRDRGQQGRLEGVTRTDCVDHGHRGSGDVDPWCAESTPSRRRRRGSARPSAPRMKARFAPGRLDRPPRTRSPCPRR